MCLCMSCYLLTSRIPQVSVKFLKGPSPVVSERGSLDGRNAVYLPYLCISHFADRVFRFCQLSGKTLVPHGTELKVLDMK